MEKEKPEPVPCACGGKVKVHQSYGGTVSCATFYMVECQSCKQRWDDYGNGDGTIRSAIRQWNRERRRGQKLAESPR